FQDVNVNIGRFSIGGSATDLRSPNVDLSAIPAGDFLSSDVNTQDVSTALSALTLPFSDDSFLVSSDHFQFSLESPVLENPQQAFELVLGSKSVKLVELHTNFDLTNPNSDPDEQDIKLYNMNFVIGIVPVNFQIDFTLPSLDFNLNMGVDSSGLGSTSNPWQGLYVDASTPIFSAQSATLSFKFGIGWDEDATDIRVGVGGDVEFNFNLFLPKYNSDGTSYLYQLESQACPLTGSGDVSGYLERFYDAALNVSPEALEESLKSLVEIAISTNPLKFPAQGLIAGIKKIYPNFQPPPGVQAALGDPSQSDLDVIFAGLNEAGYQASNDFKELTKNVMGDLQNLNPLNYLPKPSYGSVVAASNQAGQILAYVLIDTSLSSSHSWYIINPTPLYQFVYGQCDATNSLGLTGGMSMGPADLGSQSGGTLTLFMGPLANQRDVGQGATDETFIIRPTDPNTPGDGAVTVSAFGAQEMFTGVTTVVATCGAGSDTIDATGTGVAVTFTGGSGSDELIAGTGPATLTGGTGDDTLTGGPGNDSIVGGTGPGSDSIEGGGGSDYIRVGDRNAVIDGAFPWGSAQDVANDPSLVGNVTIIAGNGNDIIYTGNGNASVIAGDGTNIVRAGIGNDTLITGSGSDVIYGGTGDDLIEAGGGQSAIFAGIGNDTIYAGASNPAASDSVIGGTGDDTIYATAGTNFIMGVYGNSTIFDYGTDTVIGGTGNDSITAGNGNDVIVVGDGNDTISCGAGNDIIAAGNGNVTIQTSDVIGGSDSITAGNGNDSITAGDGNDVVHLGQGSDTVSTGNGNDSIQTGDVIGGADSITAGDGNDTIAVGDGNDLIRAGDGADSITAGDGSDTVTTGSGDSLIQVGSGNDIINTGDGQNVINAGDGNDSITCGSGNDTIQAGNGNDTVYAGAGNDYVTVGNGNDSIFGQAGNDTIYAGSGSDYVDGGPGDDQIHGGAGTDTIHGGDGNDTICAGSGPDDQIFGDGGNNVIYGSTGGGALLEGGPGHDIIIAAGGGNTIEGGSGNETLTGSPLGGDTILAGGGTDVLIARGVAGSTLVGGAGFDTLYGGVGPDILRGGTGTAVLIAGTGFGQLLDGDKATATLYGPTGVTPPANNPALGDTLLGGTGNATIWALSGNDVINGESGTDVIHGGSGSDTITGGTGNDTIYAGSGPNDQVYAGSGNTVIYGSTAGGALLQAGAGNCTIVAAGGGNTIQGGTGDNTLVGGPLGGDTIQAGTGNDVLYAMGSNADSLYGGSGNDVLYGSAGNDTLIAGTGNTRLYAGSGNTDMVGGSGNDTLTGGSGHDTLIGGSGSDLMISGIGANVLYADAPGSSGSPSKVDTLIGGSGQSTLYGGAGNDILLGQGDTLVPGSAGSQVNNASGVSASAGVFTPPTPPAIPSAIIAALPSGPELAGRWGELAGNSAVGQGLGGGGLAIEPSIAASAAGEYVAWADASSGTFQINVAEHVGGSWIALGDSTSALGVSAASGSARRPSIALDAAGDPIVAWTDFSTGGSAIKVAQYDPNTGTWLDLGGSLDAGGISGLGASDDAHVVVTSSGPVVAWIDQTGGTAQVRALLYRNGSWQPLGGGSSSAVGSDTDARDLALATDGTQVAIAWAHGSGAVRVLSSSGGAWSAVGGDGLDSLAAAGASQPTLAFYGGSLFAAWVASDGLRDQVYAAQFSGSSWSPAGTSSTSGSGISAAIVDASDPQLAASSGGLILGWTDVWNTASTPRSVVYVKQWDGASFSERVPGDAQQAGISPTSASVEGLALAVDPAGRPFAAWGQGAAQLPTIYVVGNTLEPGHVYYVNGGTSGGIYTTAPGNASNSGLSPSAPLASIQQVLSDYTLQPGDLILVDAGTYNDDVTLTTAASGVTIEGAPGGATTFAGTVSVASGDGITLQNLDLSGGLNVTGGSGLTLRDSAAGLVNIAGGTGAILTDNQIAGLTLSSPAIGTDVEFNTVSFPGVAIDGAAGLTLRGNTITSQGGDCGIEIASASSGTISGNDVSVSIGAGTALEIDAPFTGTITGNALHGANIGLAYNAAAAVGGNQIYDNATGVVATVIDPASAFGFVGASSPNQIYQNSIGVDLLGQMQGQHIFDNSDYGVTGDGTLGGSDFSDPNVIESNPIGVNFAGTIQFNRFTANAIAVEVVNSTGQGGNTADGHLIAHNVFDVNSQVGVELSGETDVRIFSNTFYSKTGDNVRIEANSSDVEIQNNILW
ncbi:MAG: beta strand repeat-containing protein, partial [Isosphaeraceae bacterium]